MKTFAFVVLFAIIVGAIARSTDEKTHRTLFTGFVDKYNKTYVNEVEKEKRFGIFKNNLAIIDKLNKLEGSAIYGISKFADLTTEEFRTSYLMPKGKIAASRSAEVPKLNLPTGQAVPSSVDWRTKGAVTPVYDQGQCGSCWAFSATEAIESQWFLAGHTLTSLSPQQIVDCDTHGEDEGCNGGDTPTAYEYVINAGGLESAKDYPYTAEDDQCVFSSSKVVAKISNWTYVTTTKDENEMQVGLANKGPLSICVDAESWQFYFGGVVSYFCGNDLDHCVMIVGYEDYTTWDEVVKPIWIIRNSWGADWGEDGYIYVERGKDLCGVADEVTLPIV